MATYMSIVRNRVKSTLPRVKDLALTSRSKVEVLKANSVAIEREFRKTRDELKRCEERLDAVKRDLQTLYTLRANEYLKPRPEQSIKEINERENQLNELEREAATAVASARLREEEQLKALQVSNETLYQTSLTYANRFIIMGLGIGSAMMAWRGYKWIRDAVRGGRTSTEELGVAGTNAAVTKTPTIVEYSKLEERLSRMNALLADLAHTQDSRLMQVEKKLSVIDEGSTSSSKSVGDSTIKETLNSVSAKMDECLSTSSHRNDQMITGTVFLLGTIGGIVGATVAMVFSLR